MSGLTPANGATGQSTTTVFRIEFCGMTGLQLNYFNLLNPDTSIVGAPGSPGFDVVSGDYWAELEPHQTLTQGVTYSLDVDGRINDNGEVKQIAAGTWEVGILESTDTLYYEDFSNTGFSIPHQLTDNECTAAQPTGFGWHHIKGQANAGAVHLVNDPTGSGRGVVLQVDFKQGEIEANNGNGIDAEIRWGSEKEEIYWAYDIYIPSTHIFNFATKAGNIATTSASLPWDSGGNGTYARVGPTWYGLNTFTQTDPDVGGGWADFDGMIRMYQYYYNGYQQYDATSVGFTKGAWNRIEVHGKLNSPRSASNGEYHFWKNGVLIQSTVTRRWLTDSKGWIRSGLFLFSGGEAGNYKYKQPQNQSVYIDNVIISESPITHS